MKKIFICLLLSSTLWSCKKEQDAIPNLKTVATGKHEVTFSVSGFSTEVANMSKSNANLASSSLKESAAFLTYLVYDETGLEVSRIRQDSSGKTTRIIREEDANEVDLGQMAYGTIQDSLADGNYTVIIAASNTLLEINNRSSGLGYDFFNLQDAFFQYHRGLESVYRTSDTYYQKLSITVSDKNMQKPISLDRVVGKIEINILDAKPDEQYKFRFENENDSFKFSDEKPFGVLSDNIIPGYYGASSSFFILNTETPINVYISCKVDGMTIEKLIANVHVVKNKRTILTGNVHSPAKSTSGFNITVNDQFDEKPNLMPF